MTLVLIRIVPNYELAPDLQQVEILRVVVRENMTEVLIDQLVTDLMEITEELMKADSPVHALNALGHGHASSSKTEHKHGKLEKGEGSASSGTYAKQC